MNLPSSRHAEAAAYGFTIESFTDIPTAAIQSKDLQTLLLNLAWANTLTDQQFARVLHHEWGHVRVIRAERARVLWSLAKDPIEEHYVIDI